VPRSALSFAYENLLRKSRYALWDGLTKRQSEIARLASDGMTNKEIAKRLAISHTTVKKHLQQIYEKLHVARRGKLGTVTT
jgi:DNA-binding NarL/FixJ family response regulator